jgi:hypothetical protein
MSSAFDRALSKPSQVVVWLSLVGWIVTVAGATWAAVALGSPLTRIGPLTGLPGPPVLTLVVAFGYWVCFTLVRWWWIRRRPRS